MIGLYEGTAVIVQCRLNSKRFPRKALAELGGKPILFHVLTAMSELPAEYFILACDRSSLRWFEPIAKETGWRCIDGDENDVLGRFCKVIDTINSDKSMPPIETIIRATADNPFLFIPAAVASMRRYFELGKPDYFTLTGLPVGSGVEILKASSLLEAARLTDDKYEREHVGPALYCHTDTFKCIREPAALEWYYPDVRTTVDTKEDYLRIKQMMLFLEKNNKPMPAVPIDIIKAADYAERLAVFVPIVREGMGSGHLRRVCNIAAVLEGTLRCVIYIPPTEQPEFSKVLLKDLPEDMVTYEMPENPTVIILDRFKSTPEEVMGYKQYAPVIALDEGGSGRYLADYILDILPSLISAKEKNASSTAYTANLLEPAFIPLPEKRKEKSLITGKRRKIFLNEKMNKVLIVCGGEDKEKSALQIAVSISRMNFDISVIEPSASFEDIKQYGGRFRLIPQMHNLKEQLHEWDLVITHYGFTAFEALAAGCCTVLVSPTEYHYELGLAAGFTVSPHKVPSAEDFQSIFQSGINVPSIITPSSKSKKLHEFILKLTHAHRYSCPMCGTDSSGNIAARTPDRTISQCRKCGMHYISFITHEPKSYTKSYFFDEYKAQYGKTYLEDFEAIRKQGLRRIQNIDSLCNSLFYKNKRYNMFSTEKKLLDIGCAYGPFLAAAKASGWLAVGTDISESAVEYVKNSLQIPAFVSSFPAMPEEFEFFYKKRITGSGYEKVSVPLSNGSFSAITMWFVIEHFQDLDSVLKKISQLLVPGGILAFSTPTISGISGRSSAGSFFAKSPSDHYSIWDARTVKKQLERYGFKVCKIISTGHHPERFNIPKILKSSSLIQQTLMHISRIFKLGDSMEVYAMKHGRLNDIE